MNNVLRLGVLGSTAGSNLLPLVALLKEKKIACAISVVISDREHAGILEKAKAHHWPVVWIPKIDTRENHDMHISRKLQECNTDLVILNGYMRILSPGFINDWKHRIYNVHPSLLPAFSGKMDKAVHQAVLDAGVDETGCTVHEVTNELDLGPIVVQQKCRVHSDDTVDSLKTRVQQLEVVALAQAIQQFHSGHFHATFAH